MESITTTARSKESVMQPEKICDYVIHIAASVFPLLEGERFQSLVDSIAEHGVQNPIVSHEGEVLDGRNRLRAVMKLREEGHKVELPCVKWESKCGVSATEWVAAQNLDRRHLSADAYVVATAAINRILRSEARKRTQSNLKRDAGPGRGRKKTEETKPSPRLSASTKSKDARSSVGQVAAKAGASMHKARQAVKLDQAVEAGVISEQVQKDVIAGKKKLKDVVPKPERKPRRKLASYLTAARAPTAPRAGEDIEPAQMLDEISYYALSFLHACPEKADELEGLLLTWVSRCKQR